VFAANGPGSEQRRAAEEEAKRTMQVAAEAAEALVRAKKESAQESGSTEIEEVHQRAADKLLWLARANKGVYIKLAQHLSQLDYLLPDAYTSTLRACLDDAPRSSWADVCATIEAELGQHPTDLFHTFEQEPIASASLAQVHVAYLRGSRGEKADKVAVKVQVRTSGSCVVAYASRTNNRGAASPETLVGWHLCDEACGGGLRQLATGGEQHATNDGGEQHARLRETSTGDVDTVSAVVRHAPHGRTQAPARVQEPVRPCACAGVAVRGRRIHTVHVQAAVMGVSSDAAVVVGGRDRGVCVCVCACACAWAWALVWVWV